MEQDITYEKAMQRLENIVSQIESGKLDVDSLATHLKEAKELISYCKDLLVKVEADVNEVMNK